MARTELKKVLEQASALAGQQITVCGWVKTIRDSKALGFIELNDGSSFSNLQVVFEDAKVPNFKEIAKCNVGTALRVTGTLTLTPNAKSTPVKLWWKASPLRIIHCRKNAIPWNICAPSLTFAPEPTPLTRRSASVQ